MKVVIRNSLTKKFWTARGNWSRNPARARDFKSSVSALKYCFDSELFKFEIVFQTEEPCPYSPSEQVSMN